MSVPLETDDHHISSAKSTATQTTTSSSSSIESLTIPDESSDNWKRQCRQTDTVDQPNDADQSESSESVDHLKSESSEPVDQHPALSTIPKHSAGSTASIDSFRPRRCVPANCEDFFDTFHRKPMHFQNHVIPDDDVSVSQAYKLLTSDPFAPGILGIATIDYNPPNANSTSAYVLWLALSIPSGKTCCFNIKDRGLPSLIRGLLLSNHFFVGFDFSSALGNSDSAFQGIDVDFDVSHCLAGIREFGIMPHVFADVCPTPLSAAYHFFAVTWPYVPGDEREINDPFLCHLAASQAVLALDVYIMLDRHAHSLNVDAVRKPGGASRYAPLSFHVWPHHSAQQPNPKGPSENSPSTKPQPVTDYPMVSPLSKILPPSLPKPARQSMDARGKPPPFRARISSCFSVLDFS